jgi:hypothetical protein
MSTFTRGRDRCKLQFNITKMFYQARNFYVNFKQMSFYQANHIKPLFTHQLNKQITYRFQTHNILKIHIQLATMFGSTINKNIGTHGRK